MTIEFYKYHGAGNDFIMLDGQLYKDLLSKEQIAFICDRRYGIGADGLILVERQDEILAMDYFNSDGTYGMMCANGARCAVHFGEKLGLCSTETVLSCMDQMYFSQIIDHDRIKIRFPDCDLPKKVRDGYLVDTGAPHFILENEEENLETLFTKGRKIRNDVVHFPVGANINFLRTVNTETRYITTYERGVEDLTHACGTGAVAAAIYDAFISGEQGAFRKAYQSLGGTLDISLELGNERAYNICITGPVQFVFIGEVEV